MTRNPGSFSSLAALAADAARKGDLEMLARVLAAGVPVGSVTPRGDSLLMLACYYEHHAAARLLLDAGADPDQRDAKGQTPLAGVAFKGAVDVAALLVARGASVNAAADDGRTPLSVAAAFNRVEMARWLLAHGASAGAPDAAGRLPIDVARAMNALDVVALLDKQ